MKNWESLKKSNDFRKVYNRGKSIANRQLVMYFLPNKKSYNRIGISVSKKVGNSVVRSRITRLIRESYRLNDDNILVGYDIIFIARNSMVGLNYFKTEKSMMHLLKKQNLYSK
ncbi:MAG: ribonuclease P protein component [Lachnospirales bacterium]